MAALDAERYLGELEEKNNLKNPWKESFWKFSVEPAIATSHGFKKLFK